MRPTAACARRPRRRRPAGSCRCSPCARTIADPEALHGVLDRCAGGGRAPRRDRRAPARRRARRPVRADRGPRRRRAARRPRRRRAARGDRRAADRDRVRRGVRRRRAARRRHGHGRRDHRRRAARRARRRRARSCSATRSARRSRREASTDAERPAAGAAAEPALLRVPATPFVGRERELDALHAAFAAGLRGARPAGSSRSRARRGSASRAWRASSWPPLGDARDRARRPLPGLRRGHGLPGARRHRSAGGPACADRGAARRRRAGDPRPARRARAAGEPVPRRPRGRCGGCWSGWRATARSSSPSRTSTGPQPALLDLLDHVVALSSGSPILLVCLTRPELLEARPAWAAPQRNRSRRSMLEALDDAQARELAQRPRRRGAGGADRAAGRGQPAVRRAARRRRRGAGRARAAGEHPGRARGAHRPPRGRASGGCSSAPRSRGARSTPARSRRCCARRRAPTSSRSCAGADRRRPARVRRRGGVSLHARADPRRRLRRRAQARARRSAHARRRLARGSGRRRTRSSATTSSRPAGSPPSCGRPRRPALAARAVERLEAASQAALGARRPRRGQRAARARAGARPAAGRAALLPALGAALFEAGRMAEATRVLDEAIAEAPRAAAAGARAGRARVRPARDRDERRHRARRGGRRRRAAGARAPRRSARAVPGLVAARAGRVDRGARAGRRRGVERGRGLRAPGGRRARAVRDRRLARDRGRARTDPGGRGDPTAARSSAPSRRQPGGRGLGAQPAGVAARDAGRLRAGGAAPARGQRDAATSSAACTRASPITRRSCGCSPASPSSPRRRCARGVETLERWATAACSRRPARCSPRRVYAQGRLEEAGELCRVAERAAAARRHRDPGHLARRAGQGPRRRGTLRARREALAREAVALVEPTDLLSHRGDAMLDLGEVLRLRSTRRRGRGGHPDRLALYDAKGNVAAARASARRGSAPDREERR